MADDAIIFALANPTPRWIQPSRASTPQWWSRAQRALPTRSTTCSRSPVCSGARSTRASRITSGMQMAAADAIAGSGRGLPGRRPSSRRSSTGGSPRTSPRLSPRRRQGRCGAALACVSRRAPGRVARPTARRLSVTVAHAAVEVIVVGRRSKCPWPHSAVRITVSAGLACLLGLPDREGQRGGAPAADDALGARELHGRREALGLRDRLALISPCSATWLISGAMPW